MSVRTFAARKSDDCDVVVIGAGMSGLSCAATLGRYGHKVMVLEQHDVAGGSTHHFKQGTEWVSAGWHYVGKLKGPAKLVWDDITDHCPMSNDPEEVYDTAVWGKNDEHVAALKKSNFKEKMGIHIKEFVRVDKHLKYYLLTKLLPGWAAMWVWLWFKISGKKAEATMNYGDWCKKVSGAKVENPVWWMQRGDHGMAKNQTIAIVHCIITAHYYNGVMHPEGGVKNVTDRICNNIKNRDGQVLVKAKVDEIQVDASGAVSGVMLEDGTVIKTKKVVCCSAYLATKLLKKPPANIVKAVKALGPGTQHGCVFLTYSGKTPKDLGLPTGNVWMLDKDIFISHKESPTGTVVYIIWETKYFQRGAGYEERKEDEAEKYSNIAFEYNPKLKDYDEMDASTPATTEHYLHALHGSSYGLDQKPCRFDNYETVRALRPQTDIPGLWLTGQDTLFPGVCTAMMEGSITAQAMTYPGLWGLFKNVWKDAYNYNKSKYEALKKAVLGEKKEQ